MKSIKELLLSDCMKDFVEETDDKKYYRGKQFENDLLKDLLAQQNFQPKESAV